MLKQLLIFSLFISFKMGSQAPGYYVTSDNDSVKGFIKVKYFIIGDSILWTKMEDEITFIDAAKKKITIEPSAEITGVGFTVNGVNYYMKTFQGKDFMQGQMCWSSDEFKFVRFTGGGKISSFSYWKNLRYGGPGAPTLGKYSLFYKSRTKEWFTFELLNKDKTARKLFAGCSKALNNFESHNSWAELGSCIDFYNNNCE